MRISVFAAALASCASALLAQADGIAAVSPSATLAPAEGQIVAGRVAGTQRWIAHFKSRSFDLAQFRRANLERRPAAEVTAIVADLERQMRRDQAAFVAAVERLGGTVVAQWWLVNAAAFEIAPARLDDVRKLDNVERLEADRWVFPVIRTATNAANHNSDAVNAAGQTGLGVATGIMDTGLDENMAGTGRPHRMFYINGDPTNTSGGGMGGSRLVVNRLIGTTGPDDPHDHGTGVAGIAASGGWTNAGADAGHAPRAQVAGYGISNSASGGSDFTTIANAWQAMAADRTAFNIVSANNSYSGSPDPLNLSQQALDSAAFNADIMVCVAAANSGASTTVSQSCANGLAVGAVSNDSHAVASFSSRGPLSSDTQRFYPDIAACGVNTVMPKRDSESTNYVASGTSMASPQVCGAATLLRAADPSMTAIETKAVLLASTRNIAAANPTPPYNSRNAYGVGLLRDDSAMAVTQRTRGQHGMAIVTSGSPTWTQSLPVTPGVTYQVAAAWMRSVMTSTAWANLDLSIRQGSTVLVSSTTPRNLYERVDFVPTASSVTIEVTATAFESGTTAQQFGWAAFEVGLGPVAGQYTVYGTGCAGSGQGGGGPVCASSNPNTTALSNLAGGNGSFAFPASSATPLSVSGFEIFTSGTGTLNTAIYLADTTGRPQGTALATGTLNLGATPAWYNTTFPVTVIPGGQNFAIEFSGLSTGSFLPIGNGGTASTHFYKPTTQTTYNGPFTSQAWAWRVNCAGGGGGAVPVLTATGVPEINASLQVNLALARANSPALLLFGVSDTVWNSLPLPIDLTPLGATNCFVRASGEVLLAGVTDAAGATSQSLAIPNSNALVSRQFFNQWAILDPANSLGVVTTNGGRGTIGRP